MDYKTLANLKQEARQAEQWERDLKTRILKISDSTKKQAEWNRNFMPRTSSDDSYLLGNIF